MLVEWGFVRATAGDGTQWSFTPSLARLAELGRPAELVELYAALHGPRAERQSAYVLAGLCDQDDPTPLVGWHDDAGWHDGLMPPAERVLIARHLLEHGMVGGARPDGGAPAEQGRFVTEFKAGDYIALARVHLGMSAADAEALSMTELQALLDAKFPQRASRSVPTRAEYDEAMRHFDALAASRKAAKTATEVQ